MDSHRRVLTIPNLLSLLRILMMIPVFIFLIQVKKELALVCMLIGAVTDFLDGYIARRWNQSSDLGRLLDPVVDKVSVLSVVLYMILSPSYEFPLWYFILLMVREGLFMLAGLLILLGPKVVVEARRPGKNAAFANAAVVIFYLFEFYPYAQIVLAIALAFTLYSTFRYFQDYAPHLKRVFQPEE
jgi:cardiolipin synthase